MKIVRDNYDQHTVFTLRGEMTAETIDEFRKAALEEMDEKTRDFILDMSNVTFIDSKGLETLIWLHEQCIERLGQIRLAACPDNIRTILRITRLDDLLQACDDIDQAIKSLAA